MAAGIADDNWKTLFELPLSSQEHPLNFHGIIRHASGTVVETSIMRARQLIDGASFGPDALNAIGKAFDVAWEEIAGNFGNDPADIDNARWKLANALLSIASEDSRDVEGLKKAALQRMALDYRHKSEAYNKKAATKPASG
jgi:hypothetical protein